MSSKPRTLSHFLGYDGVIDEEDTVEAKREDKATNTTATRTATTGVGTASEEKEGGVE